MDKKGAVELSMTTIIIIVIGITILSLGLVWIRNVFEDIDTLTKGAFEQGDAQIKEIFSGTDQSIALSPSETTVTQGKTSTASLAINNLGSSTISNVYAEVSAKALGGADAESLICAFSDTLSSKTKSYTLSSGQGLSDLKVIVEDQGSSLGTYACVVMIYNLQEGTQTTSLIVNIEE